MTPRKPVEFYADTGGPRWPFFVAGLIFVIAALGVWWYLNSQASKAKQEAAQAAALADTLEVLYLSADSALQEAERRALIAESDKELQAAINEDLRESLKRQRLTARAVVNVQTVAQDTFKMEGDTEQAGDTVSFATTHRDSTFEVDVSGRIYDERVRLSVGVLARLRQQAVLSCGEDGAPHVSILTFDRRVTTESMDAITEAGIGCFGTQLPDLSTLKPNITIGNSLLNVAAVGVGFVIGRASK